MRLPLFPLSSVVLPDGLLPLRIFERRYIDMIKNCFKNDSGFGVCLIKDGKETGAVAEPYPIGTHVSIVDFDQGDDGLLHITAKGIEEFNILTYSANQDGLIIGEVAPIVRGVATPMEPQFKELSEKLKIILNYIESDSRISETRLNDADWVIHRLLEVLPLENEAKFELLQMSSNRERLEALSSLQIEIAER